MNDEQLNNLTPEERARLSAVEQEALKMLSLRMREGRWYPRRHMRVAVFAIVVLLAIVALALGIESLF